MIFTWKFTIDARRKQKEDELLALALGPPRIVQQPFGGARPLYTGKHFIKWFYCQLPLKRKITLSLRPISAQPGHSFTLCSSLWSTHLFSSALPGGGVV